MIKKKLRNFAADFANFFGGLGMRLVWLPKIHYQKGAENVRKPNGGALFIFNHTWWVDAPLLCVLCIRRRISVITMREMFTGIRRVAMRGLRCIPVDRSIADLGCMRESLQILRGHGCVGIAPEGKLNPSPELQTFKPGAALLALQADVPVIPVYIAGNYQPFQRLQIMFGRPIVLQQRPTSSGVQAATEQLQAAMQQCEDELYAKIEPKYRNRVEEFQKRFHARRRKKLKGEMP